MATQADQAHLADIKTEYQYGFHDKEQPVFKAERGLNHAVIDQISDHKNEPDWMRQFRLKSYERFLKKPMPNWGGDMSEIFFDKIFYYIKPTDKQVDAWDELPDSVKNTYEKLGIPEA